MDDMKRMIILLSLKKAIARDDFGRLYFLQLYALRRRVEDEIELLKRKSTK